MNTGDISTEPRQPSHMVIPLARMVTFRQAGTPEGLQFQPGTTQWSTRMADLTRTKDGTSGQLAPSLRLSFNKYEEHRSYPWRTEGLPQEFYGTNGGAGSWRFEMPIDRDRNAKFKLESSTSPYSSRRHR